VFLGFGWSFVYIGASALLVDHAAQADQSKAPMINELFIWTASATAAGNLGFSRRRDGVLSRQEKHRGRSPNFRA
jgi:hypothetical protein